jgi:hypothetical protein
VQIHVARDNFSAHVRKAVQPQLHDARKAVRVVVAVRKADDDLRDLTRLDEKRTLKSARSREWPTHRIH